MRLRHASIFALCFFAVAGWLGVRTALAPAAAEGAQNPSTQAPATAPLVIKTEANLVLVDVIAADKKGNYIRDLEAKDFHVYEDEKEQPISSFASRGVEA